VAVGGSLLGAGRAHAAGQVPAMLTPPSISGTPRPGAVLKASSGTWSGNPTSYVYRWQRCNAAGRACRSIAGAKAPSYLLTSSDVGATLRVVVTARNPAGNSKPARSAPTEVVSAGAETKHLEYVLGPGTARVYSIDQGFSEVESFSLPTSAGVRGVNVCPAKHTMYVSYGGDGGGQGNGSVLAYDLVEKKLLWNRSYSHGIDYGSLTLDCSRLFEPTGENTPGNGVWWILDTANGQQVGKVETPATGPHDTVTSADGSLILLGGHNYDRLPIYSTAKGAVQQQTAELAGGVRPLTIDGTNSAVFTTATGFDGFQVSSVKTGEVLYTENFGGTCGFSTCSHGISLTPDSREAAVIDVAHKAVQFWDVHGVASGVAPVHLGNVAVAGLAGEESPCAYSCVREGWVQHSYDGRYVFVGDSGEVIESATHKVVGRIASLENSRESIEVDWQGGVPVATSQRLGVGRSG
jgi:hypothetical protein